MNENTQALHEALVFALEKIGKKDIYLFIYLASPWQKTYTIQRYNNSYTWDKTRGGDTTTVYTNYCGPYIKLKEQQYEAVRKIVVDNQDTVCVLPTGYGKCLISTTAWCIWLLLIQNNARTSSRETFYCYCHLTFKRSYARPSKQTTINFIKCYFDCFDQWFWQMGFMRTGYVQLSTNYLISGIRTITFVVANQMPVWFGFCQSRPSRSVDRA